MDFCGLKLDGKVAAAPLAGISDPVFRRICRRMGAALTYTEMVSARGLLQGNRNTVEYMTHGPAEKPLAIQLFGSAAEYIGKAAPLAQEAGADLIDLNFGCPVGKVVKKGAGSALMKTPEKIAEIVAAVVKAVEIPVMAKIRSGWDDSSRNAVEVARLAEEAGAAAVCIHARTQKMMFGGRADRSMIKAVKEAVTVPVIGNGDIRTPEDAKAMMEETGCDLVMIGRACFGNPWIFRRTDALLKGLPVPPPPGREEKFCLMEEFITDMAALYGERRGINRAKKQVSWFTRGLPLATHLRQDIFHSSSLDEVRAVLSDYRNSHTGEGMEKSKEAV